MYRSAPWEAAVAVALAHLLAASGGRRVAVPGGPLTELFRWPIDYLLPPGPPARHLVLAGPGVPVPFADLAPVPRHPQTGEPWPCDAAVVPPSAGVWTHLAFHDDRRLVLAADRMPAGVRHDDPPPLLPHSPFRPDRRVFLRTLERLETARQPWSHRLHERAEAASNPFW